MTYHKNTLCGPGLGIFNGLLTLIYMSFALNAFADTGCVAPSSPPTHIIKLGMTAAFSGPNQHLGLAMHAGISKRIEEENCSPFWRARGTAFHLVTRDDSYDPDTADTTTRELLQDEDIIALVGSVGTPTAARSWQQANDAGVVFYGAYTGAAILRQQPPAPFVINYRASYQQEMELIINDIISQGIAVKKIGLFLQDDAFGQAGLDAAKNALGRICQDCNQDLFTMRYERNSLDIDNALRTYVDAKVKPRALILVGASEPCAEFVRFAQRLMPGTRFYSLSFAGKSRLAELLPELGQQVFVARVIPPDSAQQTQLDNEVAQEGYLATARLFDALRAIPGPINSASLRDSLIALEQSLAAKGQAPQLLLDQQLMDLVWLEALIPPTSVTGE